MSPGDLRLYDRLLGIEVTPIQDGLADFRGNGEFGTAHEQTCSVFGSLHMVFEVYIQDDGKFIVHAIPLHGFKAHFLRDHLTVFFIEHIILLGTHGADDMHRRLEDFLHKGILTGCNFGPVRKRVALQACMEIQQVVPTLGDTVYDDYIHTCIFAECDSFDVILRGVVSAEGNHIVSPQVSIKIGRTIF